MTTAQTIADPQAPDAVAMRTAMVASQLRPNAVDDQRVVAAMARVQRERFLPEQARAAAYRDTAIPLGDARYANPPMATGRLLTRAELEPGDRVLLIGAAAGYTAAILSEIVAEVVAVEEHPALVALARQALDGMRGVSIVEGALAAGAPDGAPYDVLVIDGAVETLPDALIGQIRPGGRLVGGLLERGVTRLAAGRRSAGGYGLEAFVDAECVMLPGFAKPSGFRF